jgi:hypothetical protein
MIFRLFTRREPSSSQESFEEDLGENRLSAGSLIAVRISGTYPALAEWPAN